MKSFLSVCISTLLIALAGPVIADSNSGMLTFSGAITNGSCNMNVGQILSCLTVMIPPVVGLWSLLLT